MTNNKQIYLLRHGEIENRDENRYIGQTDVPLSSTGLSQAGCWQEQLSHVAFEKVYCSDLSRALDTARIVSAPTDSEIEVMAQLREINLGDWDGERMETIKKRFPDAWEERGRHLDSFQTPHGESFQDLHARVIPVFQKIAAETTGNALVVTHAGVNRIILCHVLKKPIQELFSIPQDYAALNLIEYQEGRAIVSTINRTPSENRLLGI